MKFSHFFCSLILCVCFISREVVAVLPDENSSPFIPSVIQVSPDQMEKIQKDPSVRTKHIKLDGSLTPEEQVKKEVSEENNKQNGGVGGNWGSGLGSGETAIVIFAIIGVVMVVAWIAVFPVMMYQSILGKKKIQRINVVNVKVFIFSRR